MEDIYERLAFSVNISLAFNTKFGQLPESRIQSLGLFTKFRNFSHLFSFSFLMINFKDKGD